MTRKEKRVVPRSRVTDTHRSLRTEILDALEPLIFESPMLGYSVRGEFEWQFASTVRQPFACAVHSGTIGLYLALRACGVGPGDEVITVGNSDISTTAAISQNGATPVLCDVLESDYTIDTELVASLVTERTKALLAVDLYGHPADVKRLRELADACELKIVEDAALATGAFDHDEPVGAFADATVFSFAPFKPLGCTGNGAMVTSADENVVERVRLLTGYGHGSAGPHVQFGHQAHIDEGLNVPLDPLQAAVLNVKLPYLEEWTARRRAVVEWYRTALSGLPVHMPVPRPESAPTYRSFTILVKDQARVYRRLREAGIEVVLHYSPPIYRQPVYPSGLRGSDRLAVTDRLARELVCLPVSPELTKSDVQYVADTLASVVGGDRVGL